MKNENPTYEQIVSGFIANVQGFGKKVLCCADEDRVEEVHDAIIASLDEIETRFTVRSSS